MFGEPLIGIASGRVGQATKYLVPGQLTRTTTGAWGTGSADHNGGIVYRKGYVSGAGSKTTGESTWGYQSIHGYMDPNGLLLPYSLVCSDLVQCIFDVADNWLYFGWFDFNTAHDETSVVGVGWRTTDSSQFWEAFVNEGTGTPSTSVHTDVTTVASTDPHRLSIWLDGFYKSVYFYIDGLLYSTFTPSAVPAQFGASGVKFGHAGIHDIGAWGGIRHYGGGNPRLLALIDNGVT